VDPLPTLHDPSHDVKQVPQGKNEYGDYRDEVKPHEDRTCGYQAATPSWDGHLGWDSAVYLPIITDNVP